MCDLLRALEMCVCLRVERGFGSREMMTLAAVNGKI
jgi:hypothetical protein